MVHLAAGRRCRPVSRVTTSGQRHDSVAFAAVMSGIRIRGPGRARTRPGGVLADKALATCYDKREYIYQGTVDVAQSGSGSGTRSSDPPDRP
jgi:hypothetical protein